MPRAARFRHPLESTESMPRSAARCRVAVPPMPKTWIFLPASATPCAVHAVEYILIRHSAWHAKQIGYDSSKPYCRFATQLRAFLKLL